MDGAVLSEAFVLGRKLQGSLWRFVIEANVNQLRKYLHPSWPRIT